MHHTGQTQDFQPGGYASSLMRILTLRSQLYTESIAGLIESLSTKKPAAGQSVTY